MMHRCPLAVFWNILKLSRHPPELAAREWDGILSQVSSAERR